MAGLRDLPELISTTRDLGVEVSFIPPFPRPALSPIVDMAVYRVVQQAISNALQHASGAWLRIEVTQTGDQLETTIVNGSAQRHGESRTGGVGLKVMRERAVAAGGTLETGPTPEGGWRVRLVVPVIGGEDEEER